MSMRISALELHEWMKVEVVDMTFPAAGVISIGGKNGEGKTCLKTFIEACFGGKDKCPDMPVRTGEKKALGKLTLDDDGRCVTIEVEADADRNMRVTVRQDGGPAFNGPVKMLKALVNTFSFDPFSIMKLRGREQRNTMLECLGVNFDDLEREEDLLKEQRKEAGRDVAGREKQISSMPEYAGVPKQEVSVAELAEELDKATKNNAQYEAAKHVLDVLTAGVKELEEKIKREQQQLLEMKSQMDEAAKIFNAASLQDVTPIRERLNGADEINRKVRANAARAALVKQFQADRDRFAELGEELKKIDARKQERLSQAKAPVDGLEFTSDGVMFNGLPLSQESGSGQMIRAVELVAALNPTLRTICIDDAERLMLPRLQELDEWAKKNDFQVFAFRASTGPECSFVMEDGKAVAPDA